MGNLDAENLHQIDLLLKINLPHIREFSIPKHPEKLSSETIQRIRRQPNQPQSCLSTVRAHRIVMFFALDFHTPSSLSFCRAYSIAWVLFANRLVWINSSIHLIKSSSKAMLVFTFFPIYYPTLPCYTGFCQVFG